MTRWHAFVPFVALMAMVSCRELPTEEAIAEAPLEVAVEEAGIAEVVAPSQPASTVCAGLRSELDIARARLQARPYDAVAGHTATTVEQILLHTCD